MTGIDVKHFGGCHCGAVRYVALAPSKVKVFSCNICWRKQYKGFSVPDEKFELLKGKDDLILYTFNTGVARHYFCKTCGVQSFYKPRSNPDRISVNIYCLDPGTIEEVVEEQFDGQNWEDEMKRRATIPN